MSAWAWPLALLGTVSAIYGTLVAMGQTDIKRLVAYSSINEMGYVLIGVAAAAASWAAPADRSTAATGAAYMLLAHGLATGALFFLVGSLESRTHERDIPKLGGLWKQMPRFGTLLATAAFAALGLPGMAVFVAELQVLFGTLGPFPWAAVLMLLAILIATAMFLWMLQRTLMGKLPEQWRELPDLDTRELLVLGTLVTALVIFGLWPGPLVRAMDLASRTNIVGTATKTAR
jgi:NADH-quinone oxidoreductase subunit M